MTDEHPNREEDTERSSDSPLQRRASHPGGSDIRPDGERGEGLAANRRSAQSSAGLPEQSDVFEAEVIDEVSNRVAQEIRSFTRIAPLPDPAELQAYEDIEDGLANRIVKMAEGSAEAANLATKSNAAVNNAIAESILEEGRSTKRVQWMFVSLAILFLAVAVVLELFDRTPFATGMGILGFLSLVGVIVRPKSSSQWMSSRKNEDDPKTNE
ncbi:DUF2335 domain-containing protein [Corynebacterium cystitidis]|uniref:DUF2335 domain-containing protein n=1 Tax=Corynebacterium cystitidis TaxID=35757 RepID=UPI00211ED9FB|nr:DUF2335 domain-containing protein [Corynebacterium cystitidis]